MEPQYYKRIHPSRNGTGIHLAVANPHHLREKAKVEEAPLVLRVLAEMMEATLLPQLPDSAWSAYHGLGQAIRLHPQEPRLIVNTRSNMMTVNTNRTLL